MIVPFSIVALFEILVFYLIPKGPKSIWGTIGDLGKISTLSIFIVSF
jgi:hypothetical protein